MMLILLIFFKTSVQQEGKYSYIEMGYSKLILFHRLAWYLYKWTSSIPYKYLQWYKYLRKYRILPRFFLLIRKPFISKIIF